MPLCFWSFLKIICEKKRYWCYPKSDFHDAKYIKASIETSLYVFITVAAKFPAEIYIISTWVETLEPDTFYCCHLIL